MAKSKWKRIVIATLTASLCIGASVPIQADDIQEQSQQETSEEMPEPADTVTPEITEAPETTPEATETPEVTAEPTKDETSEATVTPTNTPAPSSEKEESSNEENSESTKTVVQQEENVPVSEDAVVELASVSNATSDIDFVQYALDIAANNSIGYGHGWATHNHSTISCSGLIGVSLTECGYENFVGDYAAGCGQCGTTHSWGYLPLCDEFINRLGKAGFTEHYSYGSTELEVGDILLYITSAGYQHSGIYVGNGLIVEATGDYNGDGDGGVDGNGLEVDCHTNHNVWTDIYRNPNLHGNNYKASYNKITTNWREKGLQIVVKGLTVTDESGGKRIPSKVNAACWTDGGNRDDLVWVTLKRTEKGNYVGYYNGFKRYGKLNIHVYLNVGAKRNLGVLKKKISISAPKAEKTSVTRTGAWTYRYAVTFDSALQIETVYFPTWYTKKGTGQYHLTWYKGKKSSDGKTCSFTLDLRDYGYHCGAYSTHVYTVCGNGVERYSCKLTEKCKKPVLVTSCKSIKTAQDSKGLKIVVKGLTVTETGSGQQQTPSAVRIACWTKTGKQDDLVWVTARRNSKGYYVAYYSGYKHSGAVNIHVYADVCQQNNLFITSGKATI